MLICLLIALLFAAPAGAANHLSGEKSLYLQQHAENPVDWYPWGQAAFDRAKKEDKPIFLSIGYSTCHWCHVMERESFVDAEVARALNESFVCIKVDREEHPDVDSIYMSALQATGEGGGWPLNMFLTPDLKPFHGGTYFPKPVFLRTLAALKEAWKEDRKKIGDVSDNLVAHLKTYTVQATPGKVDMTFPARFVTAKAGSFDPSFGGFGAAPKFPPAMALRVLLRHHAVSGDAHALHMAEKTLDEMARGGMYDQLAGGFHRYSTDRQWLVPHFEKMLYDNALLARAYIEAWQVTGKPKYAATATEILDYVLREMRHPGGAFHSATDADSEGVEGKFFVWTPEQVTQVLGADAKLFCETYDVTPAGNFEHKQSILHLPKEPDAALRARLAPMREKLRVEREKRVHPARDEKVITAWSALMTQAFVAGAQAFGDARYRQAAVEAGNFLFTRMVQGDVVYRRYAGEERGHIATLEDHAYLVDAAIDLYELTFDPAWLERALALQAATDRKFRDTKQGGYFQSEPRADLIVPVKEAMDDAIPSPVMVMVTAKARLAELTGREDLKSAAQADTDAFAGSVAKYPTAFAQLALGLYLLQGDPFEIVLSGDLASKEGQELVRAVHTRLLPGRVICYAGGPDAARTAKLVPLVEGRAGTKPTAYVCRKKACKLPASDPKTLAEQLTVRPK